MKKHLIIIASFLANAFIISCNNNGENKADNQSKFIDANCDQLRDFSNAIPKMENYKEYQLEKVTCLPESKGYILVYTNKNNPLSQIHVALKDCSIKENEVFLLDIKQSYDNAEHNYKRFEKSSLTGQFASVYKDTITENGYSMMFSKFNTVLKNHYALNISVKEKAEPGKSSIFDDFIKTFATKIDTVALK